MSILLNKNTNILVQGITGSEGSFHTEQMIEYGSKVVCGVTPGKGGQKVTMKELPVFNSIHDAKKEFQIDATVIFVPPRFAAKAKPYIDKIPAGFFSDMMYAELDRAILGAPLDVSENPAKLIASKVNAARQVSVIKPELVVLALLLQNPELAGVIEEIDPKWELVNFTTKDGLLDILRTIDRFQPKNTSRLLENYRDDGVKFDWLSRLANKPVVPDGAEGFDVKAEFRGAFMRVLELGKKLPFEEVIEKGLK